MTESERSATDGALAAVIARMRGVLEPQGPPDPSLERLYGWLRYHLGWAAVNGVAADTRSAKGTRSRVCVLACAASGGEPAAAVDAAAAIELVHEFSLIHDDIEDADATRRGRPALWTIVGIPQAINAGDALFALARAAVSHGDHAPAAAMPDLLRCLDAACVRLAEGQHLDMALESGAPADAAAYEAMVARKTGALLGASAAMGAIAAEAPETTRTRLARWGELVGVAFQMRDDLLGLWGDPGATGKPAGNDLVRGKQSLPIVLGLAVPALAGAIRGCQAPARPSAADVAACLGAMEEAGIRARCQAMAAARAEAALRLLAGAALVPGPAAALAELTRCAVDRDR